MYATEGINVGTQDVQVANGAEAKKNGIVSPASRTDSNGRATSNGVLLAIPDEEFKVLRANLEFVELPVHKVLYEAGDGIEYAFFLNSGMTSLVIATSDGRSVEIGVVGKEGLIGGPLAVGLHRSPYRAVMQVPGDGHRVRAEVLERSFGASSDLRAMLNRCTQILGMQVAQLAACNRLHEIGPRLARWLLMTQDRIESDVLPITHDFLAQMLGSGRPTVSRAAGILQKAGIIEYARGIVRILKRKNLEEAACECYGIISQRFSGCA